MTFFLSGNNLLNSVTRLKGGLKTFYLAKNLASLACAFVVYQGLSAAPSFPEILDPIPIPIPAGTTLVGNPLRVDEYIDTLTVLPGSDLEYVLLHLPEDGKSFSNALDQMHPALLQDLTFATDDNMQSVRQTLTGRNSFLRNGRCIKLKGLFSDHCNIGPSEFWIAPFGVFSDQPHIGGLHGYRSTTPGMIIGVDSQPNPNNVLGIGLGYSFTDLHWKKSYGNADWQTGYLGAYWAAIYDCFYVDAAFLGSYEFYKTKRKIRFSRMDRSYDDFYCDNYKPCCDDEEGCCGQHVHHRPKKKKRLPPCGINRQARNRFRGYALLSHIGIGYKFKICGADLIPFASIDYDFVDQDGHREYRARSLDLRVKANHAHLIRTEYGLSITGCIPYNCSWVRPSATVSYVQKNVLQGRKFEANFVHYEPGSFTAKGTNKTLDFVAAGIGLETQFSNQTILRMTYDAELNRLHITQRLMIFIERAY